MRKTLVSNQPELYNTQLLLRQSLTEYETNHSGYGIRRNTSKQTLTMTVTAALIISSVYQRRMMLRNLSLTMNNAYTIY
jgi:hypothetical protein